MTVVIDGTLGVDTIQANTVTSAKIVDGSVAAVDLAQPLTLGTAQNTTSGTSIDFTSIPSWVKRITVSSSGVSTNGTSLAVIQLKTASGPETTGYSGYAIQQVSNSSGLASYTNGFAFGNGTSTSAASTRNGSCVITLLDATSNTWSMQGQWADLTGNSVIVQAAGSKSLAGTLTGIRLTTTNGTDTFDAGSVNILYEG